MATNAWTNVPSNASAHMPVPTSTMVSATTLTHEASDEYSQKPGTAASKGDHQPTHQPETTTPTSLTIRRRRHRRQCRCRCREQPTIASTSSPPPHSRLVWVSGVRVSSHLRPATPRQAQPVKARLPQRAQRTLSSPTCCQRPQCPSTPAQHTAPHHK